ncbi:MAG: NAD kinase [Betaproteobacteria bacterium]|nr:NAD kinase [Betaproteobacteria bacterium]
MSQLFKTVALIGKYNSPATGDPLLRLARFLEEQGYGVLVERQTAESTGVGAFPMASLEEIGEQADLAVVLGGDGTMLNIARALHAYGVPLVGINQGRLGFLTDVSADTMLETMAEILAGDYLSEARFLLSVTIRRHGENVHEACAFNDAVVSKGATARLIELEVFVDGQFVYSQRSDGLIVSTPTGSTAYALSSGGPILHPTLEAVVLVPICPHTLSDRPIAVNSESTIEILLLHADDARVHFDGQRHFDLQENDWVIVRRSSHMVRLLHPLGHSYYDMLRQKLHWGEKL